MCEFRHQILVGLALLALGCTGASAGAPGAVGAGSASSGGGAEASAGPPVRARAHANLAGARCQGAICSCRNPTRNAAEVPPPEAGHKRFEIRLGAGGGAAELTSPTLGQFSAGAGETCFTIDVVPGTTHEVSFVAREPRPEEGVSPTLDIAEYGPKGPWWYEVLQVSCVGPGGKCNREAADAWSVVAKTRKRGRVDPCGSAVISHLVWDSSGGTGTRELGVFRDFTVKFTMEVKKFATAFAPGSTECVPK
jgi:hypothetical protein